MSGRNLLGVDENEVFTSIEEGDEVGDYDSDDYTDGEDGEEDAEHFRRERESTAPMDILKARQDIFEKMKTLFDRDPKDPAIRGLYDEMRETCSIDKDNEHSPTILHWAVSDLTHNGDRYLDVLKCLTKLALDAQPELLKFQNRKGKETALHTAVTLGNEDFIQHLCQCKLEAAAEAISIQNDNGETCLHGAVKRRLSVAQYLVSIAHENTFKQQRRKDTSDSMTCNDGGNTVLHDAVSLQIESRSCPEKDMCARCSEAETNRERTFNLICNLVEKGNSALTVRNSVGETPYLYLISTYQVSVVNTQSAESEKTERKGRKHRGEEADGRMNREVPGKDNAKMKAGSRNATIAHHSEPTFSRKVTESTKQAKRHSGKKRRLCTALPTDVFFNQVEEYLREASFGLGGFERTCDCFFGKGIGSRGKTPIFRPGHALQEETEKYYSFLNCPETMSQVVLVVPSPETNSASTKGQAETTLDQWEEDMKTIQKVFDLLRDKNVKRILKLDVQDNPQRNCSDETIENCLHNLDVRYLDWNKIDLCVDVVLQKAPNVVELCLYSSGNRSVFRDWSSREGLCCLDKLTKVHLKAQKGLESYERNETNVRNFIAKLKENINQRRQKLRERGERVPSTFDVIEDIEKRPIGQAGPSMNAPIPGQETKIKHRWMDSAKAFARALKMAEGKDDRLRKSVIKVALIDDGVTPNKEGLKGRISPLGWPDQSPASQSALFYESHKGHGTNMADLICQVCPYVQLYVAKLEVWGDPTILERQSTAKNAAEAVKWAIEQNVQIISMSWSLIKSKHNQKDIMELENQIQIAARRGIIMYCAADDQDLYGSSTAVFPGHADTRAIKIIGSSDEGGENSKFVNVSRVEYLFPGEDVLPNHPEMKGSSAATAVAAGFAALILLCFSAAGGNDGMAEVAHSEKMDKIFKSLRAENKWVDATRLLSTEQPSASTVVARCRAALLRL